MNTIESTPYKWPYNGDLRPENTALIIIDMQTDFCGKGGYVDAMGYDLSLTRAPIQPIKTVLEAMRAKGYHILTDRGARYVRSDRTAPDYRFYALSGAGVARPGLVRTGAGEGGCVALELWDVPVAAFGGFMKTIPAPLGIGTLTLADGAAVQGFLCEAVAAQGARDITDMGDWRRFLAQSQTG